MGRQMSQAASDDKRWEREKQAAVVSTRVSLKRKREIIHQFPHVEIDSSRRRVKMSKAATSQIFTRQKEQQQQNWVQIQNLELRLQKRGLCSIALSRRKRGRWPDWTADPRQVQQGSAPTATCPASTSPSVRRSRRGRFSKPPYRRRVGNTDAAAIVCVPAGGGGKPAH